MIVANLKGWWVGLEGGEIPTTADERSACGQDGGSRDRDGRLTVAASGRSLGATCGVRFLSSEDGALGMVAGVRGVVAGMATY
jgi:hypothetical protein